MFAALVFLLATVLAALRILPRAGRFSWQHFSALCWNYFFIPPQFTFFINKVEDWIMFGMFFVVAFSMGSLTSRLGQREIAERRRLPQDGRPAFRSRQAAALSAEPEKGLSEALRTVDEATPKRTPP